MERKTLLRGGRVLTMDEGLGDFEVGDVLIEGDRIAAVGPDLGGVADETIDLGGAIVMPGLIDCHVHLWQTAVRGLAAGRWGREYFGVVHPLSARYRPQDMEVSTYAGAVELLSYGVTTVLDFCHSVNSPEHAEGSLAGLDGAGIRALYGYGFRDRPEVECRAFRTLEDRVDTLHRLYGERGSEGRVRLAVALNNIEHVEPSQHAAELGAGRELGLRATVHSNLDGQVTQAAAQGLLGDDVLWVHCGAISDPELRTMAENGGAIVCCPEVEAGLTATTPIVGRALRNGVPVGLGVDVPTAVNADLLTQMRVTYAIDRLLDGETDRRQGRASKRTETSPTLDARALIELATTGAARMLGLEAETGSLTPGKQADLVVLSNHPYGLGAGDPYDHVLFQTGSRDVDSVYVGGVPRVREGRLLDVDLGRLRGRLDASRDWVLGRGENASWHEMSEAERADYEANQGAPVG